MARARSIKPAFFDNEVLGELSPLTRLLFIGLWGRADREGRLQDRPRRLKKEILGYDDINAEDVDHMLQALHDGEFIIRYEVDGVRYIQVTNFSKHQYPSIKEVPSVIPPPPGWEPPKKAGKEADADADLDDAPNQHQPGTMPAQPVTCNLELGTGDGVPGTGIPSTGADGGGDKPPLEKQFDLFWAEYPRKTGEEPALKAWKKLKPGKDLVDQIMIGLGHAKKSNQWKKEGGQFIPEAVNWLKEKRWNDYKGGTVNGGNKPATAGSGGGKSGFVPAPVGP